jgi:hypothetical protein
MDSRAIFVSSSALFISSRRGKGEPRVPLVAVRAHFVVVPLQARDQEGLESPSSALVVHRNDESIELQAKGFQIEKELFVRPADR